MLLPGPSLQAARRNTTLEVTRAVGRHDAIVVGGGGAGGFAAQMLTRAGLRVLVLEAGSASLRSRVRRLTLSAGKGPLGSLAPKALNVLLRSKMFSRRQTIQARCYAWGSAPDEFVDDVDCPYITEPDRPFVWIRSRQLGGRVVVPTHGRQYYRLADSDLSPTDGLSASWPFRPAELDPWYAEVERYVGLAGGRDNLPWLPDSELRLLLEPTPAEAALRQVISARWPGARAVLGRSGKPIDSLERAAETNRLSIRTGAIARKIEVDASGRARGVVWIDHQSGKEERAQAPLVFLCASALESTRLLLLSRSTRSPEGLGASSGALGRYLMDHIFVQVLGKGPPLSPAQAHAERRSLYLPRFDARELPSPEAGRGFGVQVSQAPADEEWSSFSAASFGEMLPRAENRVTLDPKLRDAWGIPALRIDCRHGSEDMLLARKQVSALRELAAAFGVELTQADAEPRPPGTAIHECGTARMGNDPDSSVLDPHNECWEARGLYVTDAACFPTQGTQNPMLTILAITARACDHAVRTARTN